jgi:phosphatidylglycerophosphate synthase
MKNPEQLFRFGALLGALMLVATGNAYPIFILLAVSFILLVHRNHGELSVLRPYGGAANYITLLRALTLMALLVWTEIHHSIWPGVLALLVAIADVADGWLARKYNCATTTGGLADEQTDALYMLVMGFLAYHTHRCGVYILVPGIVKYAKDLLSAELPLIFTAHARIPLSKWLAGAGFIAYATPFLLEKTIYRPICIAAALLLCFSFGAEMLLRFRWPAKNK